MSKVRVAAFSLSIDGFGAGPRQDLQNPLGVRGPKLHEWLMQTELFKKMPGAPSLAFFAKGGIPQPPTS